MPAAVPLENTQILRRQKGANRDSVFRQGAEHYARALKRSGEGLVRFAVDNQTGMPTHAHLSDRILIYSGSAANAGETSLQLKSDGGPR